MNSQARALRASLTLFATVVVVLQTSALARGQSPVAYHPSATERAAEQKGLAAAKRSDFTEARADFLVAREADPYWPENLYYLGLATSKLPGLELSAAAWFEAYLALDPKSPRAAEIQSAIDRLVQTGRDHAAVLTNAMERMGDDFQPDEVDARKAHQALLTDELALLPLAHSNPNAYDMVSNGQYPPLQGDTSKAWVTASWLVGKGVAEDSLAHEFASWGRVELSSRIINKGEHGEDWYDFIPELIEGHFLTEMTARSMFRPADFLPEEKLSLQVLCDASIDFAAKYFAANTADSRKEAMSTIYACAQAAIKAPDPTPDARGNKSLGINPELADVIEFYLEDDNSMAAAEVYAKMDFSNPGLQENTAWLIHDTEEEENGKTGLTEKIGADRHKIDQYRTPAMAWAASAAAASSGDAYADQKQKEEKTPWAAADSPGSFVSRLGPGSRGPWLSPHEAADLWESAAQNDLTGDWFDHYDSQLQALRAHTNPNAIDKAGDLFSAGANAAKILLDGVTEVTAYQRAVVIYRPPAAPLAYTWKAAAAK